jgi:hypothetical protein
MGHKAHRMWVFEPGRPERLALSLCCGPLAALPPRSVGLFERELEGCEEEHSPDPGTNREAKRRSARREEETADDTVWVAIIAPPLGDLVSIPLGASTPAGYAYYHS